MLQFNRYKSSKSYYMQMKMSLSLSLRLILFLLTYFATVIDSFPLSVTLGTTTINTVTSYTYNFNFSSSVSRSYISLVIPSLCSFGTVTVLENGISLNSSEYIMTDNRTLRRNSPPTGQNFIYIINGIQNSPYSVQVSDFNVISNISSQMIDSSQFVTFTAGTLQSCLWTFAKYTGSSNSSVDINIKVSNSLILSNLSFIIGYTTYPDSNSSQYLTINSTTTAQYSLTGNASNLTNVSSLSVSGISISFFVNQTGTVPNGTTILIRLSGIQNPPTQTTVNTIFTISTNQLYLSNYISVDQSNGCDVSTLTMQQYTATFDKTNALQINSNYAGAKLNLITTIPNIILQNDILQMDYNSALNYASTSSLLTIQYTRHDTVIFNEVNNGTIGTKYFKAASPNNYTNQSTSTLIFIFNITTPPSQAPWTFTFTFKRPSGGYFQIVATLVSIPGTFLINSVNFTALTYEMSVQTIYTVSFMIGHNISGAGKLSMTFPSDFIFNLFSNNCTGKINNTPITSFGHTCYIQNGTSYTITFQLGGLSSNIIAAGSVIAIQINNIINPLYPKNYTFSAITYYNSQSNSITQSGTNLQTLLYTVHFVNPQILPNTFSVFKQSPFSIIYTNDVPWPKNSTVNISFPLDVYQWTFSNQILVNNVSTPVTLPNTMYSATQKWISFNTPNNITAGSNIQIPFSIITPALTGTYSYIIITVTYNSILYEQCLNGVSMQMYVNNPSTDANFSIQPINQQVGSTSKYILLINSNVPHPPAFDIIITIPTGITFVNVSNNVSSSCVANGSTCSSGIQIISNTTINVSISSNNWTSTNNTYQTFSLNISFFKNQRSLQPSNKWNFVTQKYISGFYQKIVLNTNWSSSVRISNTLTASLVSSADYYRSNSNLVGINIALSSITQAGDYLMLYFNTQQTYSINPNIPLKCPAPLNTNCTITNQTTLTFYIKVMLPTGISSSFELDIQGLISYSASQYNVAKYISATRYNLNSYQIDVGQISYAISCGNSTVANLKCKTCYSNNTCGSCYSGTFLLNGACVTNCSILSNYSTYQNQTTNKCDPCIHPCLTCSSDTSCLTCATDKLYFLLSDYTCNLVCNISNGYWIQTFNGESLCVSCIQNCLTCLNGSYTGCTKCNSSYYLYNGNCTLNNCPLSGQFADSTNTCFNCDTACSTCYALGSSSCIACKSQYKNNSGTCVLSCPTTLYSFPNKTCGCGNNCLTCLSSSSTYCLTCNSTGGSALYAYKGICYSSCPLQTYDSGNGACSDCVTNCQICTSNISCTKCIPSNYLYSNKCYSDCNLISQQFDVGHDGKSCYKCPTGCDTCSLTVCSTCLTNYTLIDGACTLACSLTGSCTVPNQVPQSIMPLPGTLSVIIWIGIVIAMKLIVGKLYAPYSMVFMFSLIEYFLIISTAVYADNLSSTISRLLAMDDSYRSTIFSLLIVALVFNYLTNILFLIIFFLYIKPLISSPRQVDIITNGVVLVLGTLTNYRFCLLIFSKMFPKPQIPIQNSSKLTPVHYLCITSAFLSVFAFAAAGIIVKNEYPLTDIFMLGIDIIIIQLLLAGFSIWMVAINKDQQYFNNDVKKYNIEQMYRTQQGILDDQKNVSKANIKNQNDFQYLNDSIRFDKRINQDRLSAVNLQKQEVPSSDMENNPLPRVSKMKNVNMEALKVKPKVNQEEGDLDITHIEQSKVYQENAFQKKQKAGTRRRNLKMVQDKGLRNKSKQDAVNFGKNKSPQKVLQYNKEQQSEIQIDDLSSSQIPNLPLNNSVFHKKTSQQFGSKLPKPKLNSHRSTMIEKKKKSFQNMSEKKVDMKKKNNKMFESDIGQDSNVQVQEMDIDAIIQSKIIMTKNSKIQNISSIQKKQEQGSQQFNQEISPSWFNIQNQRYQFSENDSDIP